MRKFIVILFLVLSMAGCSKKEERKLDEEKYQSYLSYYQSLLDYNEKNDRCGEFDISVAVNVLDNGKYRYDIIVDNSRIAMYDIEALTIIKTEENVINEKEMMPSSGIFDDCFCIVPNQINKEKGYVQGLVMSITSDQPSLNLATVVSWKDKERNVTYRRYFLLSGSAENAE